MGTEEQRHRKRIIAQSLQRARKNAGLTQAAMADLTGKQPSTIGAYEEGVNNVPTDILLAYCEQCQIEPNKLLGFTPKAPSDEDIELQSLLSSLNSNQKKALINLLKSFKLKWSRCQGHTPDSFTRNKT
jgi:transcriptional regulator with XRE-family HTH domain